MISILSKSFKTAKNFNNPAILRYTTATELDAITNSRYFSTLSTKSSVHSKASTSSTNETQNFFRNHRDQFNRSGYWTLMAFLVGFGLYQVNNEKSLRPKSQAEEFNDPEQCKKQFDQCMNEGRIEDAIKAMDRFISLKPQDPTGYMFKGMGLSKLGLLRESVDCMDKAIEILPNPTLALIKKATLLNTMGDHVAAFGLLQKAFKYAPDHPHALFVTANVLHDLGNKEAAVQFYDDLTQRLGFNNKFDSTVHTKIGLLLGEMEDNLKAMYCHDKAIELDRTNASAYNNKGYLMVTGNLGTKEEANEHFNKALQLDPFSHPKFTEGIVRIDYDKGTVKKALEQLDKAIRLNPRYAAAYYKKGLLLTRTGSNDEAAIECFDKTVELCPEFVEVYRTKGLLLKLLGREEAAEKCFEAAANLNPETPESKFWVDFLKKGKFEKN